MNDFRDLTDEEDEGQPEAEEDEEAEAEEATPEASSSGPSKSQKKRGLGKRGPYKKRDMSPESLQSPTEADLLWTDICARRPNGLNAELINIRVARIDQGDEYTLGYIDGASVGGSESATPGDQLWNVIVTKFHWHMSKGLPAKYRLQFNPKRGGTFGKSGTLSLPSTADLAAIMEGRSGRSGVGAPPPPPMYPGVGVGAPQQQQPYQQPYQQPPQYYPSYSQQQQQQPSSEVQQLRDEVRVLARLVEASVRGAPPRYGTGQPQYGQPQQQQQPQRQQPQQPQPLPLDALDQVMRILGPLGLTISPIGAGAIPVQQAVQPPQPLPTRVERAESAVDEMESLADIIDRGKKAATRMLGGKVPVEADEEEAPKEEEQGPGFQVVGIGSQWDDGSEVKIAIDDEGDVDWMKTAFANPRPAMKLAGIAETLAKNIGVGVPGMTAKPSAPAPQIPPPPPIRNGAGKASEEDDDSFNF